MELLGNAVFINEMRWSSENFRNKNVLLELKTLKRFCFSCHYCSFYSNDGWERQFEIKKSNARHKSWCWWLFAVRLRSAWVLMYCIAFITHPPLIFFVYTKHGCNCRLISLNCGTQEINEMKLELRKPKQVLMQRPLLRLHPDGFRFYESAITQMSVSISFDGQLPGNIASWKCKNNFASVFKIFIAICVEIRVKGSARSLTSR